ncbi:tetratricopeptide repeat protein [Alkalibacillus aidingensis]|uniref:tetratricopeptide repeat protein n=1 Tax=Alkalibacillus aidingensis TaxID=2747607 RepID=UPI0016609965|nr:tetratricopeptide repeat protein [Alkalibacillus aidingensis]
METISEALELKEQGRISEAVQLLKNYISEAEDSERLDIAQLLHEWGLLNDAKEVYEDMLILYPNDHYVRLLLAEIETDLGNDEEVIEILEEIDSEDEAYIPALVQMADMYQSQGLFEVAEKKLLEAKELDSGEPIIDLALAELAFSNGEYQKAIPYYERVERYDDDISVVNIKERLAESLSSIGNWEEALGYYEQVKLESPDQLFKYGYTAYQLDRYDICTRVWNELLELDPEYTSVYPLLATSLYEEGALQEAFDITVQGIKKDEHNNELYLLAAEYAVKLNKVDQAIDYLKEAVAIDPGYEDGVDMLIKIYLDEDKLDEAKELVDELLKFEGYPSLLNWRAAQVYNAFEEFEDAKKMYEKAYPEYSDDPNFLKEYGLFLIEEGATEKATQILTTYLQHEPEDEDVREFVIRMQSE